MPISKELMLAILAMDAYNRGYNSGIVGPNGNAQTGLGLTGQIGLATVQANSSNLDMPGNVGRDQAASFFAISYSWNGQTVISYRGTDEKFYDALNGYGLVLGSPYGDEARVALH